jgi:hypothetical protein
MISSVLVIPPKGDPEGLLRAGYCGAQPPRYFVPHVWNQSGLDALASRECLRCGVREWQASGGVREWLANAGDTSGGCRALPLVWLTVPVPEGIDRLRRIYAIDLDDDDFLRDAEELRDIGVEWGTIVLLDVDGNEVSGG